MMTNYNKFSSKAAESVESKGDNVEASVSEKPKKTEKIEEPKVTRGKVNCGLLNVRTDKSTDSNLVNIIMQNEEVEIDYSKSNDEWLHVYLSSGIDGYVMKKFITV